MLNVLSAASQEETEFIYRIINCSSNLNLAFQWECYCLAILKCVRFLLFICLYIYLSFLFTSTGFHSTMFQWRTGNFWHVNNLSRTEIHFWLFQKRKEKRKEIKSRGKKENSAIDFTGTPKHKPQILSNSNYLYLSSTITRWLSTYWKYGFYFI